MVSITISDGVGPSNFGKSLVADEVSLPVLVRAVRRKRRFCQNTLKIFLEFFFRKFIYFY